MSNLNTIIGAAAVTELKNQNRKYPVLRKTFTKQQTIAEIISLCLIPVFGIGLLLNVGVMIWWWKSDPIQVVNTATKEKFMMTASEFKKYKQMVKGHAKDVKTADDIVK